MSRTKGSGWGAGPLLYQVCPGCGKKKCIYDPIDGAEWHKPFRCTICKDEFGNSNRFDSTRLIKKKYP